MTRGQAGEGSGRGGACPCLCARRRVLALAPGTQDGDLKVGLREGESLVRESGLPRAGTLVLRAIAGIWTVPRRAMCLVLSPCHYWGVAGGFRLPGVCPRRRLGPCLSPLTVTLATR